MKITRYAVYYAPPEGSALAQFGAAWLGWDAARGVPVPHPDAFIQIAEITATPRKYGFHATLKPPFRLANGMTIESVKRGMTALAASKRAFDGPPLRLQRLGRFLALTPSDPSALIDDLAAACVRDLDHLRAPLTAAEEAKRRARFLTPAQEAYLTRWGYPYVMGEFRFHLTLTGALDDLDEVEEALTHITAQHCIDPMPVPDICLFGEGEDGRFRILERYPLTG